MFNSKTMLFASVAALSLVCGMAGSYVMKASSTHQGTLKLATVNMQILKDGSKIFSNFKDLMEEKQKVSFEEINKIETDLKKEYDAIQKLSETLKTPTKEFADRRQEFEKKVADLDQLARTKKEALDQEFSKIAIDIESTIRQIVEDIAKERGLQVVINSNILEQQVILHTEFDVTDEVLKRFDEKMSSSSLFEKK